MTATLGIIIAITQLGGYYFYFRSIKNGVRPNTTSWTIWTFGNILEIASYIYLTGDWVKDLLPLACGFSSVLLYIYCLSRGKFNKLTSGDYVLIFSDVAATLLWYVTASPLVGNLAYLVSTIISFIPIFREIYDENENETPLPWFIWSLAYFMSIILVVLRWEKWGDIIYPLTYFVLSALTLILILDFRRKQKGKNIFHPPLNLNIKYLEHTFKDEYEVETYLYVKKSGIAGKGLFTHKAFKKGDQVFVMKGPYLNFYPKNKQESIALPNVVGIDKDLWMDPISPYEFINHRCNPNVIAGEDAVTYYALRDIKENEELTFDYSTSESSDWEMECNCGSKKCRRLIQSIEKLPKETYKRYFPYVPTYFQKVYIKNYIEKNN